MSNFLTVTRVPQGQFSIRPGAVGYLEFGVSEETAPYLVTTSIATVWVSKIHEGGVVKAAIRSRCTPEQFFQESIEAIFEAGQHLNWGNVNPLNLEGVESAIEHIRFYDMGEMEILVPQEPDFDLDILSAFEIPQRPSSWVPQDLMVVVPKNRDFVGGCWRVNSTDIIGLVHNAARGVAIVSNRLKGVDDLAADNTVQIEPD